MMRWQRRASVAVVLCLAMVGLSACGGGGTQASQPPAQTTAEPVELNLLAFPGISIESLGDVNYEFNRLYPNARVRIKDAGGLQLFSPGGLNEAALDGVDVILLPENLLAVAARNNLVKDLSAIRVPALNDLAAGVYDDLGQVEGKRYGLPTSVSAGMMMLNEEAIKTAGARMPAADWTWQDFEQIAAATRAAGMNNLVTAASLLDLAVRSYGGLIYDADTETWALDSPEAKQGLAMLGSLASQGLVQTGGPTGAVIMRAGPGGTGAGGGMARGGGPMGGVAMLSLGNTGAMIRTTGYRSHPYPRGPRGQFAPATATVAAVVSSSTNPEMAIEYVKFLLSADAQYYLARGGARPVIDDARAVAAWQEQVGDSQAEAMEVALRGAYVSRTPDLGTVLSGLTPYLDGQADLETAVSNLMAQLNQ